MEAKNVKEKIHFVHYKAHYLIFLSKMSPL